MMDENRIVTFLETSFVLLILMSMTFLSGIATAFLSITAGLGVLEMIPYVVGVTTYFGVATGLTVRRYEENLYKVTGVTK